MQTTLFERRSHLPRLPSGHYGGHTLVHWTMAVDRRETGWLHKAFHNHFREILLHTLARHHLACPVYCLMPDHLHLLWLGLSPDCDQRLACKFFRTHLNAALRPFRLQLQAHDHVLRQHECRRDALAAVCHYVLQNPVRAGLCPSWQDYPFSNALVPGYPALDVRQLDFWETFWKIYERLTAG
jgi:putative transposase